MWALLILMLGSLLKSLYIPLAQSTLWCLFILSDTVHSQAKDSLQHQFCRLPTPQGFQARHLWEKICPAESWGQPLTAHSWYYHQLNACQKPASQGVFSPLECEHFCIILMAKIKACDKTLYESKFLFRLSSNEKCVKSSILLGTYYRVSWSNLPLSHGEPLEDYWKRTGHALYILIQRRPLCEGYVKISLYCYPGASI